MTIRKCAPALMAISVISTVFSTSVFAQSREQTVRETRVFSAKMWTPVEPSKIGECPSFVFRLDNLLEEKIRYERAELSVYWVSNNKLQTINGFRPKDPRRMIHLIDDSGLLTSADMLNRQVINVCDAWPGKNRVTMVVRYTTVGGRVGNFKMTSAFCVRSANEDCAETPSVPGVDPDADTTGVVDHSRHPATRFPIEFIPGRTANTITESECPAPSYTIAPNDGHVGCVDNDAFPQGTLIAIEKSIGCPAGTTRTGGGTDTFRELCVRDDHALGLRWHLGFRLPRSVRSTSGGLDGYMPVDTPTYSQWYLSVGSRLSQTATRYERVSDEGVAQYSTVVAGSAGKLPAMQGGYWRMTTDASFAAKAWNAENEDHAAVYCGYAPTIALCSLTRSDLNSFPHIVEAMYVQTSPGTDTTPLYLYGNTDIVTQGMIDAGSVNAAVLTQSRSLIGHTSQN